MTENNLSCMSDREILCFRPCEKFLSHPRYLTPGSFCVQVFFFNTGCIGRHVISSLSTHVTMTSKRFNSKWWSKSSFAALWHARKRIHHSCKVWIDKSVPPVTVWHHSASLVMPKCDPWDRFVYPYPTLM